MELSVMIATFFKRIAILAIIGAAILGSNQSANATLVVTIQETAGPGSHAAINVPVMTIGGQFVATFTGSVGAFVLESLTVTSNSPTGFGQAMLQDISLSTRNTTQQSATLVITVSDNTFTFPGAPNSTLMLDSNLASSSVVGGRVGGNPVTGSGTFVSTLDGTSTNPLTLNAAGQIDTSTPATRGPGASYTLSNSLTVVLGGSGTGQFTGTTTASVVPEPATIATVIAGLPVLGLMAWRRRRKTQA